MKIDFGAVAQAIRALVDASEHLPPEQREHVHGNIRAVAETFTAAQEASLACRGLSSATLLQRH